MRALVAWRVGLFFDSSDRRRDRGVVCVFSIFNVGESVLGACVCIRTHTHTLQGTFM